jgi:XTP/dITP diphosphohydrolase
MKKLFIATTNKGKLVEIKEFLQGIPYEMTSPEKDEGVEETGKTFAENALLKAKTYGTASGELTLAEDSGMEVDALEGRPGVYSARFYPGTAEDRNNKILEEMAGVPDDKRTARYVCAVALYHPETGKIWTSEGTCEGKITDKPSGKGGFGFDPIFFSFDSQRVMAEMTREEKNKISHRGRALMKIKDVLNEYIKNQ